MSILGSRPCSWSVQWGCQGRATLRQERRAGLPFLLRASLRRAACRASVAARSLSGDAAARRSRRHSTSLPFVALTSSFHRSWLRTARPSLVLHPLWIHASSQLVAPSNRYRLVVWTYTAESAGHTRRPSRAARIAIRFAVVSGSPPLFPSGLSSRAHTTPQPPEPRGPVQDAFTYT